MNVENRTIFEGDNLHIPRGLYLKKIDNFRFFDTLFKSVLCGITTLLERIFI